jgi:uncharacterized protein (DUF1778 family)
MTISLRLNNEDTNLIKKYSKLHNMTVSKFRRETILEKIEDELDLKSYEKAIEEYKANPVTYTHEEIIKMLELE